MMDTIHVDMGQVQANVINCIYARRKNKNARVQELYKKNQKRLAQIVVENE